MTLMIPDPELTLEEALRLHGASNECQSRDLVLEKARDKVVEACAKAWKIDPAEAARVEEGLRLIQRLQGDE